MDNQPNAVTLLVDGAVLKKHIAKMGRPYKPQLVIQCLSHMVQAVRQQTNNAPVVLQYYGAQMKEAISFPISKKPYCEPELKLALRHCNIPGATLQCFWGKGTYPLSQPWILKPSAYSKENLTDDDFVLNEKPKGVLSQLIGYMAEHSVRRPNVPLYVYGDAEDMAYALHTSKWLGAEIHQMELHGKTPVISEVSAAAEQHFCDKDTMQQVGLMMSTQPDDALLMKQLRAKCPDKDKKSILMIDLGVVRKHIENLGYRLNVHNMQELLKQITDSLGAQPTQIIFYGAMVADKILVSPFPGAARVQVDSSFEKKITSLPNVNFSFGKTMQDKDYPAILKKEYWLVSPKKRGYDSYSYNIHQVGVDARFAYDMSLFSMDPMVSQLYVVATDGDFANPVEKASSRGLPVSLIHLDFGAKDLSFRLQREADETIHVLRNTDDLASRALNRKGTNKDDKRQQSDTKLKKMHKMKRSWAKADAAEEDDYDEPTKMDRIAANKAANRKFLRSRIQRRQ